MVRRCLLVLLLVPGLVPPAWGVVIVTDTGVRVGGYLVGDDGTTVTIRRKRDDGTEVQEQFARAKVTVVQSIKTERLQELKPENPRAYRDYAEELAAKKDDPEARDAAIRLFLIAAHLDQDGLGRSCLLAAAPLGRDAREGRRFRAMAYLIDPKHDKETLKEVAQPPAPDPTKTPEWSNFVGALRAYRQGNYTDAMKRANEPGVAKFFAESPGIISHKNFLAKSSAPENPNGAPDGNTDLIRKIVRLELEYEENAQPLPNEAKSGNAGGPWRASTNPAGRLAPPTLTIETLTEFDPRESLFRAGKWQRPDSVKKP